MTKKKWLPANVTEFRDRHGKKRWRFRKTGLPTYSFKHAPGTTEFMEEYRLAQNAEKPEKEERHIRGTVNAVVASLYATPRWQSMRPSSKKTYQSIIDRFCAGNGHLMVANITTGVIDRKLAAMQGTPAAANNLRKALSRIFRQAIKMGLVTVNPVDATDAYRTDGDGWHTWTEEEIEQFQNYWPIGTRERLAMELLLHTATRRSDMIRLSPANRVEDRFVLRHSKNDSDTSIRISDELAAAIAPFENSTGPYLQTEFGAGFSSGDSFGNWFRKRMRAAGLPEHCSAHGLRKAISRRLAESGATNQQGRAVTGHKTDREFTRYAAKANKRVLADEALANLDKRFAKKKGETSTKS